MKEFKPILLQHRGPDCCKNVSKTVVPGIMGVFCGSVLHFRGLLTVQPLELNGNIFLWNGEVFSGLQVAYLILIVCIYCERLKLIVPEFSGKSKLTWTKFVQRFLSSGGMLFRNISLLVERLFDCGSELKFTYLLTVLMLVLTLCQLIGVLALLGFKAIHYLLSRCVVKTTGQVKAHKKERSRLYSDMIS